MDDLTGLIGKRIRLLAMLEDPEPVPPGTTGTVRFVDDFGRWSKVGVTWDIDRSLPLIVPPDQFEVLP